MNNEADSIKLERYLVEVRIRLSQFANRIEFGNDDYADILKLSDRIGTIQESLGLPVFLKCETRKAPEKYLVQIGGMVGYVSKLLVVRVYDPENQDSGIQNAFPKGGWNPDGSEVTQSNDRMIELLDRSIRFVALERQADVLANHQTIEPPTDYVTLLQCAGMVNKNKRTLERWKTNDTTFPTPEVIGSNGTADEWLWTTIKPYLEVKASRNLPVIFPAHIAR